MGDDVAGERPLAHLNGAETTLALEKLRGEFGKEVVRINGELALMRQGQELGDKALELARTGLDVDKRGIEVLIRKLEERVTDLETGGKLLEGKLWLPLTATGAICLGIGAAIAKVLFP